MSWDITQQKAGVMNWDGEDVVDVIAVGHSGDYGHANGQDQ